MNPRLQITLLGTTLALALAAGAMLVLAARSEPAEDRPADVWPRSSFEGSMMPRGVKAQDFALSDENGERITMQEFRGRPVIVAFAYTTCEDSCPLEVQQVRVALDRLADDGYDEVPAIVVAVDPPRDTAARARRFLAEQGVLGRVRFVLGSERDLAPIWKGFAIQPQSDDVEHQARITVVDAEGYQRVGFFMDYLTPEALAHDVAVLLREAGVEPS